MSRLEVVNPGVMTLLQDTGRFGCGHQGIAQGGALDLHAYCWANYLLGNSMACPQLEVTVGQAAFRAYDDMTLALTGADLGATVNGAPIKPWRSFQLLKGQVLQFRFPEQGMRAYLAVPGGFIARQTFGSVATVVRDQLGGLIKEGEAVGHGEPLRKGDILQLQAHNINTRISQRVPDIYIPQYGNPVRLRMNESNQQAQFPESSKNTFYRATYVITPDSNRMGCRLKGPAVEGYAAAGIISEGIALGAVQIPANGQPIILLNDRQTLGGYSKLGCVARMDLSALAQAMPGTKVNFVRGCLNETTAELVLFMRFFRL